MFQSILKFFRTNHDLQLIIGMALVPTLLLFIAMSGKSLFYDKHSSWQYDRIVVKDATGTAYIIEKNELQNETYLITKVSRERYDSLLNYSWGN
jgi:hypothetical protein